ncbi:MAG TPA: arsenate reductase ArsC [Candidatus Limnocylindria bacterium]
MEPLRVLFVCTHNSARSQMAEGMLRAWGGEQFSAYSAGLDPSDIRPEAVKAMAEIGIDISQQQSKTIERFVEQPFNWVITVCDYSRQHCPVFSGADASAHWAVDDPSEITGSEEERLNAFRQARDDLRSRMRMFILAASRDDLPRPSETVIGR